LTVLEKKLATHSDWVEEYLPRDHFEDESRMRRKEK